ncbi:hypothetical protein PHYBLDRAFT_63779 [Phycomyces blakesleeanus NRRL 1555(-)]|uniref:Uncharacterized protein n=1 Tax=Phycomyces blakesleeanus (strain ATCC 8743b / DSM 1359 / FGSC 10004 / NBRC 33097 / NRRL 1555) TaxID=763407 RepID=A0A162U576_PHYB8|nr:hypothetical protein PHYBLDRAFT_63779 [Phycomyces blakesleeanus NRRL 1555(-)]OAD73532.1 hypothetical protein PHYBLDRAFT_63779 [Phycomyces blakesleeanus NRRL 1555(-)]|eukprot:XP_018291572.1 hypothetical protein PHYBLDRAFT_63779 [Phycomyces blakesleeanus NRRL 1555(-)]
MIISIYREFIYISYSTLDMRNCENSNIAGHIMREHEPILAFGSHLHNTGLNVWYMLVPEISQSDFLISRLKKVADMSLCSAIRGTATFKESVIIRGFQQSFKLLNLNF